MNHVHRLIDLRLRPKEQANELPRQSSVRGHTHTAFPWRLAKQKAVTQQQPQIKLGFLFLAHEDAEWSTSVLLVPCVCPFDWDSVGLQHPATNLTNLQKTFYLAWLSLLCAKMEQATTMTAAPFVDEQKELIDLIDFLADKRPEVRDLRRHGCQSALLLSVVVAEPGSPHCVNLLSQVQAAAADIIQGLTGSAEGISKLKWQLAKLISALLRLVVGPSELSSKALTSLVNLSQDQRVVDELLSSRVVGRAMDYLREGSCPHPRLLVRPADDHPAPPLAKP